LERDLKMLEACALGDVVFFLLGNHSYGLLFVAPFEALIEIYKLTFTPIQLQTLR
jgi:hypothetical protein